MRSKQSGVMLLEALIAILIFSLGILGVVGMQASAVKANRDAKYRADAGLLANELVGQMMSGDRTGTTLQTNFQGDDDDLLGTSLLTDGPLFLQWRARVRCLTWCRSQRSESDRHAGPSWSAANQQCRDDRCALVAAE